MPIIPIHYSKELIALIESMLNSDPKRRPTVNKILRDAFIKKNIMLFLERTKQKYKNFVFLFWNTLFKKLTIKFLPLL